MHGHVKRHNNVKSVDKFPSSSIAINIETKFRCSIVKLVIFITKKGKCYQLSVLSRRLKQVTNKFTSEVLSLLVCSSHIQTNQTQFENVVQSMPCLLWNVNKITKLRLKLCSSETTEQNQNGILNEENFNKFINTYMCPKTEWTKRQQFFCQYNFHGIFAPQSFAISAQILIVFFLLVLFIRTDSQCKKNAIENIERQKKAEKMKEKRSLQNEQHFRCQYLVVYVSFMKFFIVFNDVF